MDEDVTRPKTYDEVRREAISRAIWSGNELPVEIKKLCRTWSTYRSLAEDLTKEAAAFAIANNISPEVFEYGVCEDALDFLNSLTQAFVEPPAFDQSDEDDILRLRMKLDFWKHKDNIFGLVRAKQVTYLSRAELESAASQYLALPFRSQRVDRILVDALVALELLQFSDEMLNDSTNALLGRQSALTQKHVIRVWLRELFFSSLFFGGVIVAGFALEHWRVISGGTVLWVVGIAFLIWAVLAAVATIAMPFAWYRQARTRQKTLDLMAAMNGAYSSLNSQEIISANHVLDRVKAAANIGVIWPSPLYAVLDDNIRRVGRF